MYGSHVIIKDKSRHSKNEWDIQGKVEVEVQGAFVS